MHFRITPACAGNSATQNLYIEGDKDHPRVCGEQDFMLEDFMLEDGSPPRVRGTVWGSVMTAGGYRITPACAGNSIKRLSQMKWF